MNDYTLNQLVARCSGSSQMTPMLEMPFLRVELDQENRPPGSTGQSKLTRSIPEPTRSALATVSVNRSNHLVAPSADSQDKVKLKPQSTSTVRVSRRNERERNRVRLINLGFERLRAVVPSQSGEQLSKISTLRKAIWYIEHLDRVLHGQASDCSNRNRSTSDVDSSLARDDECVVDSKAAVEPSSASSVETGLKRRASQQPSVQHEPQRHRPKHRIQQEHQSRSDMEVDAAVDRLRTHGAVRMASWSYPDPTTGPYGELGSRGRSVNTGMTLSPLISTSSQSLATQTLSPIFPTQWSRTGIELASTPKVCGNDTRRDSGYSSLGLTATPTRDQLQFEQKQAVIHESANEGFPSNWRNSFMFNGSTPGSSFQFGSWWGNRDT